MKYFTFVKVYTTPVGEQIIVESGGKTLQDHIDTLTIKHEDTDIYAHVTDAMMHEILDDIAHSIDKHKASK